MRKILADVPIQLPVIELMVMIIRAEGNYQVGRAEQSLLQYMGYTNIDTIACRTSSCLILRTIALSMSVMVE